MDSATGSSQIHKHEYRVRDLPTRAVTLFASRAQVVRDIKNVQLQPGVSEIVILGLTPTIDEQSIKVEGTGSAIITDIAVESLPNREIFEEIYPDSEDGESPDSSSDEDSDDSLGSVHLEEIPESNELKNVRAKLTTLRDESSCNNEVVTSARHRQGWLDNYYNMISGSRGFRREAAEGFDVPGAMKTYEEERNKVFVAHMEAERRGKELEKEINDLCKEESKLEKEQLNLFKLRNKERKAILKEHAKALRLREKEKEKKRRRKAEALKEKARIRRERESFWPKNCFTLRIKLEAADFTPLSSRRSSVAGDMTTIVPDNSKKHDELVGPMTCALSLSYITAYAFWSPKYDLQLSTTSNSGLLGFDAELTNLTSETWSDCKVTLSTSQTTITSLNEVIPSLVPWHVKLGGRHAALMEASNHGPNGDICNSREERQHRESWNLRNSMTNVIQKHRAEIFGNDPVPMKKPKIQQPMMKRRQQQQQQQEEYQVMQSVQLGRSQTVRNNVDTAIPNSVFTTGPVPAGAPSNAAAVRDFLNEDQDDMENEERGDIQMEPTDSIDGLTLNLKQLDFLESSYEETGLTTTYDLPGNKTLSPSPTASKQHISRVKFTNVFFSHTIIPKYQPAAYLKAKVKNGSKMTLLKGLAGLTLDGSFMGCTSLPRCSPGEFFTLSLGIDSAIKVAYPRPEVQRLTTGFFTKEDSSTYTRSITLANTRATASKPATVLVLDQVPVSEDEKLRVEILRPKGMSVGGDTLATGEAVGFGDDYGSSSSSASASLNKDWGSAKVQLKKDGQVAWDVSLNAGHATRLVLEYGVALPAKEKVVQC